jgi:hypothetical protein
MKTAVNFAFEEVWPPIFEPSNTIGDRVGIDVER